MAVCNLHFSIFNLHFKFLLRFFWHSTSVFVEFGPPGFVQAADLGDAAGHVEVAGARAFVVAAGDGEIAVADVVDELADELMDFAVGILPGGAVFVLRRGQCAFRIEAAAHAPVAGLQWGRVVFENKDLSGFDVDGQLQLLAGFELRRA